jgi:hypothetical protein
MADRYQDRPFPADDGYDRGGEPHAPARTEADPLAELARLIGQTDPFAMGRANQPVQPRSEREPYQPPAPAVEEEPAPGPPSWMRRATPQAAPAAPQQEDYEQDYPSAVHPLHRHAAPLAAPEPDYHPAPSYANAGQEPDPSRYDDALYGQFDHGGPPNSQHDPAYGDDAYAYQDGYGDAAEEPAKKRGGGMVTVAVVLVLAVVGTGAAFAYRTFAGSPRNGEPPIIKADNSPTKIVPAPADGSAKVPDRMATADGKEKIVPREEAPVDVNARTGPRVVFPPLNPNSNPPSAASVATAGALPATGAGNGTLPNGTEPRRIKTLAVRGDQADAAAAPVNAPAPAKPAPAKSNAAPAAAPAPAAPRSPPSSANASANGPLSLTPQAPPGAPAAATRVATANSAPAASNGGGGYLVQVASQKNESDAQASYKALQGKYPAVLGSRSPLIKRADLGDKGVYYRAMIGPFGSADEATQFCGNLKTAGGQCVIQRN